MTKKIKKSVSILLALVMLCGVLTVAPVTVGATATTYTTADGKGTYSFDPVTGELHLISGEFTGTAWQNVSVDNVITWIAPIDYTKIKKVTAAEGVKFTGDCTKMFFGFTAPNPNNNQGFGACNLIDLSNVDISGVTSMNCMFANNKSLTNVVFSSNKYDSDNPALTDMSNMFYNCEVLGSKGDLIDLSNINTKNVTTVGCMFRNCNSIKKLKLFTDTAKVTDFAQMFRGCINLRKVYSGDNEPEDNSFRVGLNTSNAKDLAYMFSSCVSLETIDLSTFHTTTVTNMSSMFLDCGYLSFSGFETSGLKKIIFSDKFKTDKVTDMHEMFCNCNKLESLNLNYELSENTVEVNKVLFNTTKVRNMGRMFEGCSSLKSLYVSSFNTNGVTDMHRMFMGCKELTSLDLSGFAPSSLWKASEMFDGCKELEMLDLSGFAFDTTRAVYTDSMFNDCPELKALIVSDKFTDVTGGITAAMKLNNGENNTGGWHILGDIYWDDQNSKYYNITVSGTGDNAVITEEEYLPLEDDFNTYIWNGYFGVAWKGYDGKNLVKPNQIQKSGTMDNAIHIYPSYNGETPTMLDSEGNTVTYFGWKDNLTPQNEYSLELIEDNDGLPATPHDITYTAMFPEKSTYTLNYIYQGRSGGNKGAYVGDDGDTDEKTYTVTVELGASDLEESGMPKAKVLVDNAPVVNDPYKNCRWTFTDEYVRFDPENKVVTITANQPERLYRVELKNSDNSLIYTTRVKLNSFVQKDDSFITAPETDNSGQPFAYWSVVQNGKETARCFERRFNLRVTGDSIVTAHYGEAENLVTLSDAEISRQQFTENGTTKDLLYADFITAYMNKQGMELSQKTDSEYKTGIIVQYSPEILVDKQNAPGATLSENDKKTFAVGDELTAADAKTIANGGTVSGGKYSYRSAQIDNTKYNDKNRYNNSLKFRNTDLMRRMVLCAYYYVYNVKTAEIEMTTPVYFYFYDKGNEVYSDN